MKDSQKFYTPIAFPIRMVLVEQANGQKYAFRVPEGLNPAVGQWVLCKTRNGTQPGKIASQTIVIPDEESFEFIISLIAVKKLEPIVAVLCPISAKDTATIVIGQGIEHEVMTTPGVPSDEPYVTVHMPSCACVNSNSSGVVK